MLPLIVLLSVLGVGNCIVCIPQLCANAVQEPLNCPGSIVEKGGFCGCTDVCAKVSRVFVLVQSNLYVKATQVNLKMWPL